jgi:HSP20 family protein
MARRKQQEWFWQVGAELQRLHEELSGSRPTLATGRCWEPRVDLLENHEALVVRAEIAGVRAEDIVLVFLDDRNSLLIRGVRREDAAINEDRTGIHLLEIYYGEFEREVRLPDIPLLRDKIRAQYRNGFLTVLIPKDETVVVTASVTIKTI